MPLRVGVIGAGMIGQEHTRRLTTVVTGAEVVAISDLATDRAERLAAETGARAYASGAEVIAGPDVDAVLVTSWGPTHAEYVLGAVAAGKPVFCEKPLATDAAETACAISKRRWPTAGGWSRSGSCAATTTPTSDAEEARRRGGDRHTADGALRPPQPHRAGVVHHRDGHAGHRGPRGRRPALAAGRGDRLGAGAHARARRGTGSTTCRTRRSCCSRPPAASASTWRSSSTASTATTSAARSSARPGPPGCPTRPGLRCATTGAERPVARTGASGSATPSTPRSRPGSTPSPPAPPPARPPGTDTRRPRSVTPPWRRSRPGRWSPSAWKTAPPSTSERQQ